MKLRIALAGLALLCCGGTAHTQSRPGLNMREGLWRIDVEMTLPGKGPEGGGPVFRELCLDASNMQQIVMPTSDMCKATVTKQQRDMMDWRMTCSQNGYDAFSRAHFEFTGEKFAGAILTTVSRFNMEFRTIVRGKYLRACPAGQAPAKPLLPQAPASAEKPVAPLKPYRP